MILLSFYIQMLILCIIKHQTGIGFAFEMTDVNITWMNETLRQNFSHPRNHETADQRAAKVKAMEFIANFFSDLSLEVVMQNFYIDDVDLNGTNVIGILHGNKTTDQGNKIIIVGTHYDTTARKLMTGKGIIGYSMFFNGGGVVGLMETARLMSDYGEKGKTIVFVAFDFHYHPLNLQVNGLGSDLDCCLGARYFVKDWLPEFTNKSSINGNNFEVEDVVILESILNYKSKPNSQYFTDEFRLFGDIYDEVYSKGAKGNFITAISRTNDERLLLFEELWITADRPEYVIQTIEVLPQFVSGSLLKTFQLYFSIDVYPFFEKGYNVLGLSDTGGFYRTHRFNCIQECVMDISIAFNNCTWYCPENYTIKIEELEFAAKIIYTLVRTVQALSKKDVTDAASKTTTSASVTQKTTQQTTKTTTQTTTQQTTQVYKSCRKDFYSYDDSIDLYYKLYFDKEDKTSWSLAKYRCEMDGSQLLIISDMKIYNFFQRIDFTLPEFWIGMTDSENEGDWKWVDGSNVTLDIWGTCEPSEGFDCGLLQTHSSGVKAVDCSSFSYGYICSCHSERKQLKKDECFIEGYDHIPHIDLFYQVYDHEQYFMNWTTAEAYCKGEGASLLTVLNMEEYSFLSTIMDGKKNLNTGNQNGKYFAGITYEHDKWSLVDGYNITRFPMSDRTLSENDKLACATIVIDQLGLRIDFDDCDIKLPFVCGLHCKTDRMLHIKTYIDNPAVILATENKLKLVKFYSPVSITVLKQIDTKENVYSFDYIYNKSLIYWHSRESTYIMQSWLDERSSEQNKIVKTEDVYTDIVIDWLTEKLYWTCMVDNVVSVSLLNGKKMKVLYKNGIQSPQNIIIDFLEGRLYWREPNVIKVASMDGNTNSVKIFSPGKIKFIANHFKGNRLLYSYKNRVGRIYDEENSRLDTCRELTNDIQVFDAFQPDDYHYKLLLDFVTFAASGKSLMLYDAGVLTMVYLAYSEILSIKVYNENNRLIGSPSELVNPCLTNNGNCQNLCLLSSENQYSCVCPYDDIFVKEKKLKCEIDVCGQDNGGCSHTCNTSRMYPYRICTCPGGFALLEDAITCVNSEELKDMVLFTNEYGLWKMWLQTKNHLKILLPFEDFIVTYSGGFDYDPIEDHIYWTKLGEFPIFRAHLNASDEEEFYPNTDHLELRSIRIDWLSRNLIYSAAIRSTIESVELIEQINKIIVSTETDCQPTSVDIDVFNGYIYYRVQCAFDTLYTHIYQTRTDGSQVNRIIKNVESHISKHPFAVDAVSGFVFWIGGAQNQLLGKATTLGKNNKYIISTGSGFIYDNIIILGDSLVYYGGGVLWRMPQDGKTIDALQSSGFSSTAMKSIHRGLISDINNSECTDAMKCLSVPGKWSCLLPNQICDGINHCYDRHDEMYCNNCPNHCDVISLELTCHPKTKTSDTEIENKTKYIFDWDSHIFSEFIRFEEVLSSDCMTSYTLLDHSTLLSHEFKVYSFQILHRLRQIIISNVLRRLSKSIEKLELHGISLLKSWTESPFNQALSLDSLKIINTGTTSIIENTFLPLNRLSSLTILIPLLSKIELGAFNGLDNCQNIKVQNSKITDLDPLLFNTTSSLLYLDLSYNKIEILPQGLFDELKKLILFDIRGNNIILTSRIFSQNLEMQTIYSDTYALCCIKPTSVSAERCFAPLFDVSSCTDLIENLALRSFLWLLGLMAVSGNLFAMLYRPIFQDGFFKDSFSVFVGNLSFSDFLMGIYMIAIASVDVHFRGDYVWNEYNWRKSTLCKILGMISFISSESSVITISLITINRYLLVKYPFKEIKISRKFAFIACIISWIFSIVLAVVPVYFFENLYSDSGICVALPLTSNMTEEWFFSFSVFIVFNFIIFLFIAFAQWPIYSRVKEISTNVRSTAANVEQKVAKKLSMVVITDCLCWLPIGVMGLMALSGYSMPRDIYAWTIVFILPVNSALNPFIYTFTKAIDLRPMFDKLTRLKEKKIYKTIKTISVWGAFILSALTLLVLVAVQLTYGTYFVHDQPTSYKILEEQKESFKQIQADISIITDEIDSLQMVLDKPTECISPPQIPHVWQNNPYDVNTAIGNKVSYKCRWSDVSDGGNDTIFCQENGTWTDLEMKCSVCHTSRATHIDYFYLKVDGICYLWYTERIVYSDADYLCKADGARLMVGDTPNKFVKIVYHIMNNMGTFVNILFNNFYWVDGKRSANADLHDWRYVNGTKMKFADFKGKSMNATHGIDSCAAIDSWDGKLVSFPCTSILGTFCEYKN